MKAVLVILVFAIFIFILRRWLKIQNINANTHRLISSLGGVEIIFAPIVTNIKNTFACETVSYSWNRVVVCNAVLGSSVLKSDITFRLRRTFSSYVITYSSTGKSMPRFTHTWTFPSQMNLDKVWELICIDIGVSHKLEEPSVKPNFTRQHSNDNIPNLRDLIVKFNFKYSFKILPQYIAEYSNGSREYIDVMSPLDISMEFEQLFGKIQISTSTLRSNPEIEINTFRMPSNGGIGEVKTLLFIRNKRTRFAKLYSLEYSLDNDFCICSVTTDAHANFGIYPEHQFLDFCTSHFLKSQGKNNVHIVSTTPLLEYARNKKMKVTGEMINPNTGEKFRSCAFMNLDGSITLVGFSSTIGELTPEQIVSQKHELIIVELSNGALKLTRKP